MLILILALLGIAGSAFAYPTIVKDYPTLKACQGQGGYVPCKPGDQGFGLPQFIRYIFIFALGSVGIIGLMAIIMAAFDYVMAIGNPQKASNAKDKLLSAFLGMLLLLGSYVALEMINPDLLKLKLKPPTITVSPPPGDNTTANHKCLCCCYLAGQTPCTPTNPISRVGTWGNNECKKTTTDQANTDCKRSCDAFCIDYPPGHGVSWKRILCQ